VGCVPDVSEEPTAFIFKVTLVQPTNFGAEDGGKVSLRNDSKRGHFHTQIESISTLNHQDGFTSVTI